MAIAQQKNEALQKREQSLDEVIKQTHLALGEFVKGNPEPMKLMFSHREDVSLANPFGPCCLA